MSEEQSTGGDRPLHIAYYAREAGGKTFWDRCGAAWPHKDGKGGYQIRFDLFPINGSVINLLVNPPKNG